jgi:aspartyl aminopeptidase
MPRDTDANTVQGKVLLTDTRKTTVYTDDHHLVATLGVDDLVIVHTEDATLVARKDQVQDIKCIVEALKMQGLERYT